MKSALKKIRSGKSQVTHLYPGRVMPGLPNRRVAHHTHAPRPHGHAIAGRRSERDLDEAVARNRARIAKGQAPVRVSR